MSHRLVLAGVLGLTVVVGLAACGRPRDVAPGDLAARPFEWPGDLPLATDRLTLVLLLHPQRADGLACVDALERSLRESAHPLRAYVLVPGAEGGPAVDRARDLRGVTIVVDPRGRLAARCGARTSGHVAIYGVDGLLRFAGDLTATGGPGRLALRALLART